MWPLILGAAALMFLRPRSSSTAPGSIAHDLALAILASPDVLVALARAVQSAPQAFAHSSAEVRQIAATVAARPDIAADLAREIRSRPEMLALLVNELARNGALAVAAAAAVQRAVGVVPASPPVAPPAAPPPAAPPPAASEWQSPVNAAGVPYFTPGASDPATVHAAWDVLRVWPEMSRTGVARSGLAQWQRTLGVTPADGAVTIATFDRARSVLDAWQTAQVAAGRRS